MLVNLLFLEWLSIQSCIFCQVKASMHVSMCIYRCIYIYICTPWKKSNLELILVKKKSQFSRWVSVLVFILFIVCVILSTLSLHFIFDLPLHLSLSGCKHCYFLCPLDIIHSCHIMTWFVYNNIHLNLAFLSVMSNILVCSLMSSFFRYLILWC